MTAGERCASPRRCDSSNVLAATARALGRSCCSPSTCAPATATCLHSRSHQPHGALCCLNGDAGHRRDGALSPAPAAARIRALLPPHTCLVAVSYFSAAAAAQACAAVLPRRCMSSGAGAQSLAQLLACSPGTRFCCNVAGAGPHYAHSALGGVRGGGRCAAALDVGVGAARAWARRTLMAR